MFIYLNGKEEEVEFVSVAKAELRRKRSKADMCISKFLERKRIRQEVVTVEQNGQIIDKGKFEDTLLNEGDKVEFVYYMGGGFVLISIWKFCVNFYLEVKLTHRKKSTLRLQHG